MKIKWDENKAQSNLYNHKVSFDEAQTVLLDESVITDEDLRDYEGEQRYISVGMSRQGRILTVVWTLNFDTIRIISSWKANKHNQQRYYD